MATPPAPNEWHPAYSDQRKVRVLDRPVVEQEVSVSTADSCVAGDHAAKFVDSDEPLVPEGLADVRRGPDGTVLREDQFALRLGDDRRVRVVALEADRLRDLDVELARVACASAFEPVEQ